MTSPQALAAHALSVFRALLLPPLLYVLACEGTTATIVTLALLLTAAFTDLADGYLARRAGQLSQLGRILDPIADKVFIGGLGVGLFLWRDFPAWLLAAQLARDAAIVGVGFVLLRTRNLVIGANRFGKYATVSMVIVGLAYLVPVSVLVRQVLTYVAGAMLLVSSVSYFRLLRAVLSGTEIS